jgi:glutamate synthase domain-containing protein 1
MERVAAKLGHDSFTWRTVPTNNRSLGKSAVAVEPIVEQWFLSSRGIKEALDTEQQVGDGSKTQHASAVRLLCAGWWWRVCHPIVERWSLSSRAGATQLTVGRLGSSQQSCSG